MKHAIISKEQVKTTAQHVSNFFKPSKYATTSSNKDRKERLASDLTLMCCRDLLPFSIVFNEGFQDFLMAYGIINRVDDIPSRASLSSFHLNKLYDTYMDRVKEALKKAPNYSSMTCDMWTDKFRHRSYICFTLHCVDSSFISRSYTLRNEPFDHPHTGEAIMQRLIKVCDDFGLNANKIIIVSDKGSNVQKAWRLAHLLYLPCAAHGLRNLLMVDVIPKIDGLTISLDKVQAIISKLRCRENELREAFLLSTNDSNDSITEDLHTTFELLDADMSSPIALYEDEDDDNTHFALLRTTLIERENHSTNPSTESKKFHTLKKRVCTRWNTILIMLRSFLPNINAIRIVLARMDSVDMLPSFDELELLKVLVIYLSAFKSATTILSASKANPTLNLYLLLRKEIERISQSDEDDNEFMFNLKELIRNNIEQRLPVSELSCTAFILDPSLSKIDIDDYLQIIGKSKEKLLQSMIERFKLNNNQDSTLSSSDSITTNSSSTSTSLSASASSVYIADKRCLSIESLDKQPTDLKKLKTSLIELHSESAAKYSQLSSETNAYLQVNVACDDILLCWQNAQSSYPHLAQLAQIVLAVPATSTPSEEVFSTSGLILSAKQTQLAPDQGGKSGSRHPGILWILRIPNVSSGSFGSPMYPLDPLDPQCILWILRIPNGSSEFPEYPLYVCYSLYIIKLS
ncbi:unnamed protein product [Rotaria sp. Silwood1]|nr:unnamed protein product [Rotaria sp. Silwood1]